MRQPSEKVSRNTSLAVGHLTHRARKQEGLAPASLEEKPSVDPGLAREGGHRDSSCGMQTSVVAACGLSSFGTKPQPHPQPSSPAGPVLCNWQNYCTKTAQIMSNSPQTVPPSFPFFLLHPCPPRPLHPFASAGSSPLPSGSSLTPSPPLPSPTFMWAVQ